MIPQITSIHELEKSFRAVLIEQSEIKADNVLNLVSIRGQDLDELVDEMTLMSYNVSDSVMLFEITTRYTDESITMQDKDELLSYAPFNLSIIIYGNRSNIVAQTLKARLESERLRLQLRSLGIHFERISNIATLNEFKNNTMWPRNDMTIEFSSAMIIQQIGVDDDFETSEINDVIKVDN